MVNHRIRTWAGLLALTSAVVQAQSADRFAEWMAAVARGDLGRSFWRNDTVADLLLRRGPITVQIALMAITFSWIIG